MYLYGLLDLHQLAHQGLIYLQAAGGVQNDHVLAALPGICHGVPGDIHNGLARAHGEALNAHALRIDLELLDGGGAVYVAGHQQRYLALTLETSGQLGRRSGLT